MRLEAQRQGQRLAVAPDVIQHKLVDMRNTLNGGDIRAKQGLLKKIVA